MNECMIIAFLVGVLVILIWLFTGFMKQSRRIDLSQRLEGGKVGIDGIVEKEEETMGELMAQVGIAPFLIAIAVFVIVFAVVYGLLRLFGA